MGNEGSKVIFKISFKHPNLKSTKQNNASHVAYIATRSGVDKTLTEADLQKEMEKGGLEDDDYARYIGERPQSHGLFGQNGIENPKAIQEELSNYNHYVYRTIISIREDDAQNLGFTDKAKWEDMLRSKVFDMADKMGIKATNLRWVGAIHMAQGHPHAHVLIWEKTPTRTIGIIKQQSIDNIKKILTKEIFEDERLQLLQEKTIMRDLLKDLTVREVSTAVKDFKEINDKLDEILLGDKGIRIAPKLFDNKERELIAQISLIAEKLPQQGNMLYKFMPEDVKEQIDKTVSYLMDQTNFKALLEQNIKTVEKLESLKLSTPEEIEKAIGDVEKDLKKRLAQIVLKGAIESSKQNAFHVVEELSEKALKVIQELNKPIDLKYEKEKILKEMATVLVKTDFPNKEINEYLKKYAELQGIQFSDNHIKNLTIKTLESIQNRRNPSFEKLLEKPTKAQIKKDIDKHLTVLKSVGVPENEALKRIKKALELDELKSQQLEDKGTYKALKTDYSSVRSAVGVVDKIDKTLTNLSTVMAVSNVSKQSAKEILMDWNTKTKSNIKEDQLNKILDKGYKRVDDTKVWGRTTVVNTKDWKEMFRNLGVNKEETPAWMYKGENWQSKNQEVSLGSMAQGLWKSVWGALEKQKMQTEAQVQQMQKQMAKQQGSMSKEAKIEQSKKNKANTLYKENDLEM